MNFDQELNRLADLYTAQGYRVSVRPKAEELPAFAKDFRVEIAGRRGAEGVLVTVKKNRDELSADADVSRYAEATGAQPGWRFDLVLLEAEPLLSRETWDAQDFSNEEISKSLADAEQMSGMGFVRPAIITAWSAFEAAMRTWLRAAGERAGWGAMAQSMMNELYSSGALSPDEFARLERLSRVRNQIAHGFSSPSAEEGAVHFMSDITHRLLDESHPKKQAV